MSLICFCFRVDKPSILASIAGGCRTVEDLGAALRVGMGCGGCIPDLENLLRFHREENTSPSPSLPAIP